MHILPPAIFIAGWYSTCMTDGNNQAPYGFSRDPQTVTKKPFPHYYGNTVRVIFIIAAFVMLASALFDEGLLAFYLLAGIFGALTLTILAGLTNPKTMSVLIAEAVVAALAFLIFEYFAISAYRQTESLTDIIFLLRQILAILFITALYFSVKTVRGMKLEKNTQK